MAMQSLLNIQTLVTESILRRQSEKLPPKHAMTFVITRAHSGKKPSFAR
jgi:hypothetical protein